MPPENTPSFLLAAVMLAFAAGYTLSIARCFARRLSKQTPPSNIRPNVITDFNARVSAPQVNPRAYIDPQCSIIGNVHIGSGVFVAPFASIRGDEGQPIHISAGANVQDGVVLHALETEHNGQETGQNLFDVGGQKYAVYIAPNVSLAHQCQVHGPAVVGENTFVGMQSFVFKARVGKNVIIEPGALVMGVTVPDERYVPAGRVVTTPEAAEALPTVTETYAFKNINAGVLHVNRQLAGGYIKSRPPARL